MLEELREILADQLDAIAEAVDQSNCDEPDHVENSRFEIFPVRLRADDALADSAQATSVNWRAFRYRTRHQGLQAQSATLNKAASIINGMTQLICGAETCGEGEAIGTEMAP